MPRPLTPGLEQRILDAAHALWSEGGADALSIRAVAERAGTHPPRIYARFQDKEALLLALRSRAVEHWRARISGAHSLRDGLSRYLDFAQDEPFEYQLLFGPGFLRRVDPTDAGRPIEVLKRALAWERGGDPDSYDNSARSIWALLHGTVMLLTEFASEPTRSNFRADCLDACEMLAAQLPQLVSSDRR